MIDHITLNVKDPKKSRKFFAEALAPRGYQVVMEYPGGVGFGLDPDGNNIEAVCHEAQG